jgi:hypothetical protein
MKLGLVDAPKILRVQRCSLKRTKMNRQRLATTLPVNN